MSFIKRVGQDIKQGHNLDVYITITISIAVALLGIMGVANTAIILSAVLASLALVSGSLLVNRRENDEIRKSLILYKPQSVAAQFLQFGYDLKDLFQWVRTSHEVYFWGTTFTTHIPLLKDDLEQGLKKGLKIKVLLIKPSSNSLKMAAFRSKNIKEENLNNDLARSLSILSDLACQAPKGSLDVKVVDYLPPYTIYIFDPDLSDGHILAHLSTFHLENNLFRPTFQLTSENEKIWFDHFLEQFRSIWQVAEPVIQPAAIDGKKISREMES